MKLTVIRVIVSASAPLCLAAFAGGVGPAGDEKPGYHVTGLASLGGNNSRGNSINDSGLVAGYSNLPGNQARRATIWHDGELIRLRTFGGTNSSVGWPVKNNSGLVVGIAQTDVVQPRGETWSCRIFFPAPDNTRFTCLGFAWEKGRMRRLPTLGGDNGFATGANNHRQVVGWAEKDVVDDTCVAPQVLQFRAVLWDLNRSKTYELPPFGDDSSGAATAINDRGQVVGISGRCDQAVGRFTAIHAVLWERGRVRNLGNLGGGHWNTPTAINERGDIAGFASQPGDDPDDPQLRAFLWTERDGVCDRLPGTKICDLGTLPGHATSQASGINNRGQVVGTSCPAAGPCHAFLWEDGVMKDLNDFKGDFPLHLENAMDINKRGQITGRALDIPADVRTAFVATPNRGASGK